MQDRDQYVYFTIKLLKGSFALNALWQDALNYHMIDQPDKLIALRITEYYELVSRGALRPGPSMLGVAPSPAPLQPPMNAGNNGVPASAASVSGRLPEFSPAPQTPASTPPVSTPAMSAPPASTPPVGQSQDEAVVNTPSSAVEQNAEDAADYWAPL